MQERGALPVVQRRLGITANLRCVCAIYSTANVSVAPLAYSKLLPLLLASVSNFHNATTLSVNLCCLLSRKLIEFSVAHSFWKCILTVVALFGITELQFTRIPLPHACCSLDSSCCCQQYQPETAKAIV